MEGAHARHPANKKAKKTTTSKRKPHRIIESDDEDAPAPSQKKEKKAVRPVQLARETQPPSDSEHDYEDEDGNLAGFVVSDGETY